LKSLRIDTGDPDLDDMLRGHRLNVITDYGIKRMALVE